MYRLVAVDIDGTLLDDRLQLSEPNKEAICRVREMGIPVILCSARAPQSILPVVAEFDGTDPVVSHNGAVVINTDYSVRFICTIDKKNLESTLELCRSLDVHYDVNDIDVVYVEKMATWVEEMYAQYFVKPVQVPDILSVPDLKPVRIMLCGESIKMAGTYDMLKAMDLPDLSVQWSAADFIDIRHREANKKNGIMWLAEQMGLVPEQILAIGNYYNDIALLKWAGKGVAVANAPAEVREAADAVVAANNESGVAEALRKFVLRK